jgi:subtilisin-like proprotein convertase family protein
MRLCLFGMLVLVVGSWTSGSPPQQDSDPVLTVHASGAHKLLVLTEDRPALDRLSRLGVIQRQIDYESFRLLVVGDRAIRALSEQALSNVTVRDDFDLVTINRWTIDTREGEPKDLPADRLDRPGIHERQFYLVQFVGPAKDEWLADLKGPGDLDVVAYLPSNAYAVFASPAAWQRISSEASRPGSVVQWAGSYHPAYRVSPALEEAIARGDREVDVVVEFVEHPGVGRSVADLRAHASAQIMDDVSLGGMRDVRVRIPASRIALLATQPDVYWIEPCPPKVPMDEVQGQIVAANLDATGTQPAAPGYLAWLNGKGFTSNFPFTVDVADDGIDRGSTSDVHQDFRDASGLPRVTYVLNYTPDPEVDSAGGHGNLAAATIGGYNNIQDNTSYEDENFYQYGLGIAPYTRVGASKVFSNAGAFTAAGYTALIANAYNNGARISNNSWGLQGPNQNKYTTDSRSYDILVRDAVSGSPGNQEMVIVFSAGNFGLSGANTVTAPGTGKNVLTVGASENFRQTGTADCGGDTAADNAKDIASFSSRGPTFDLRKKPDIMAPGTRIQGAASRSDNYNGSGACSLYWPLGGQTLYTWSSGTSFSAPAVAGAAALARQWFANQGWGTPSPAMTKAFLMATPTHMTGVGANDTLPSNSQGYGRLDLKRALDGTASIRVDQSQTFGATGQTPYTLTGSVANAGQPFRVMLAWSDAPGTVNGNAWVNNLDLEVTVNGSLYRGNVFSGANSTTGGSADTRNNTEAVFLPSATGAFTVVVRATGISGDGVPGNADPSDQDFALFVYNGTRPDFTVAASPSTYTVSQGGGTNYAVTVGSVGGYSSSTTLSVGGLPSGATASFSANPVTPPSGGSIGSTLSVTTSGNTPAGSYPLTITGTNGALSNKVVVTLVVQTQVFTYYAAPGLTIPDNNATGVTSAIPVSASMPVASVSVYVNITHLNIGDLEVSLIGPDNTTVILHNRTGGTADNIVTTYNITSRSSQNLLAFVGKSMTGDWKLKVRDLAAGITGTVNSWNVAFNGYSIGPMIPEIPDNSTAGATSTINVFATGKVDNLRVRVFISHDFDIGQLEVSLIGPDGTSVLLHNQTGSGQYLDTVYPDVTSPAQSLTAFTGKAIAGAWTLKARDLVAGGISVLPSWEIDFGTGQGVEITLIEAPSSDAGPNQGQPIPSGAHYLNVDEDPHDGDTSTLGFISAGTKEAFTIADHLFDSDRITSVKVRWVAKKGGSIDDWEGRAGLSVDTGGGVYADYYGPTVVLAGSYETREETFTTNPATGQPWTVQAVRSARLIYQQVSVQQALPRAKLTEIVLIVTLGRIPVSIPPLVELPNSDAGPNGGSPNPSGAHYLNVVDDPHDGDTSTLGFISAGTKEVFTFADLLFDSDRVTSVTVRWVAKKGSGSDWQAKVGLVMAIPGQCPAGECYGPAVSLTGPYVIREETFLTNPATGLLWTVQDVRTAKLIYQQVAVEQQLPRARLTQIQLVVTVERAPL